MKKLYLCAFMVIYGMSANGIVGVACAQETKMGEGALFGGVLGAVAGGAIGHGKHKTTEGVLIGGAIGALGGAAVGSQMKSTPAKQAVPATAQSAASAASKVTMKQIIYWTEQGLPSEEIISRIKKANTSFMLTADDIDYLHKQNVSEQVIEAMQEK
jgi:uncharacterized protein YcfJ